MISKQDLEKFFEKETFGRCVPFERHEVLATFMSFQICQEINKLTDAVNKLTELISTSNTDAPKGRKPKNKEE